MRQNDLSLICSVSLLAMTWHNWASLVAQMVKNLPAVLRPGFDPCVGKIPWRRPRKPTPVFLPEESPWIEVPDGLQSLGSQRVRHDWATNHSTWHNSEYQYWLWHILSEGEKGIYILWICFPISKVEITSSHYLLGRINKITCEVGITLQMDLAYSPFFHLNIYNYNSLTSDTDFEFQVEYKVNF